jgi:hypothetical protein
MGLLDDAIREHLDLKRRSGGDPAEIERLEREALGPVRRDLTGAAPTATAYEEPPTEYLLEHRDEEAGADVPRAEIVGSPPEPQPKRRGFLHRRSAPAKPDPVPPPEPDSFEPEPDELSSQATRPPSDHGDDSEPPHLTRAGEKEASPGPAADRPVTPLDQPTVEHQVLEDSDDAEAEEDDRPTNDRSTEATPEASEQDDDVLEETPEFLQDTPEHDRLWFEQRPPKDFDFDG